MGRRSVSSLEGFSEGYFGVGWRKGEGETIAGESWVMTEVGDGFSVRGQLSTVFFTGVFGSGGKRWQLRLDILLLWILVMGGICCDDVFSTVLVVSGVTVVMVL